MIKFENSLSKMLSLKQEETIQINTEKRNNFPIKL